MLWRHPSGSRGTAFTFAQEIHSVMFAGSSHGVTPQELPLCPVCRESTPTLSAELCTRPPLGMAGANVWEHLFSGASGCCVVGRCQTVVIRF